MHHDTPLMSTIVVGLVLAFALGTLAQRFRISPLVGYLMAGVIMGPFTPGYVADQNLANELAEIGIILLMFGVGLHFSLKDLLSVRAIAIPGAIAQIAVATLLGIGLSHALGWSIGAGVVFGLALSVASTVVLLRALQERRLVDTERGRIAVGWLIVEDIAMVLTLVLLPALAGILKGEAATTSLSALAWPLAVTLGKVAAFVVFMLVVGRRVIPWMLHYVAHTGSRELFRLAVFAISLGVAFGAAVLFDVSFALGAFFAGMILSESELSHRAAQETLPLRDAFAVLFFVSVGMLVDPAIAVREPLELIATVLIIMLGKSAAAFFIVRLFGHPTSTALTISASLAQIGEFSFILAGLGVSLALLPAEGRDLVLAGAIVSILLNPVCFAVLDRFLAREAAKTPAQPAAAKSVAKPETPRDPLPASALADHVVLVGHGRVGRAVGTALRSAGTPMLVIEDSPGAVERLRSEGIEVITGNAAGSGMLEAANVAASRALLVAIPNAFEGGQIVAKARALSPTLPIIARAHSEEEIAHLTHHGANSVIMGELEIAKAMITQVANAARVPGPAATPGAPDAPPAASPATSAVGASAAGASAA
ncbi:Kef family K(+) transporter [Bradyrhizobium sp. U87765 SZCCT0131]|uniref:YbaL family putative K(+) efflux transporter n=1 Tax=unclassified Bradyrhizobium TaxID=2631580 RepID=UPI001BA5939D|nr:MULTISPECIES: YbaL family putative K(+) efflux transporter [unclassified Bradyrhizobium]MBR1222805.1 Kef family K(+) transporter [Bradyrhizobium sp. U87765 SZCCT0131]MBR1262541.1 Kef family K(+) transporter [Bradyrhizobium sp. U87765 SZCCT0134]MBR1308987.1 Kef family K(+) transporter [Bradyrhizobium sp. U87765 SZCCT0110]MBR1318323.1 Kef family K(+) transporter [Bradyrhizobium sp. U87765 SZCCT0109]MBR1352027.1 Kef family K(+) transporter [Bradyrhizobium sp. U87765 SZCCT0048]